MVTAFAMARLTRTNLKSGAKSSWKTSRGYVSISFAERRRAIGSGVEHILHTDGVTSSNLVSPTIYFRALYNARFLFWALSSAGEHHLHTVGVAGSNPVAPTIELPGQKLVFFWLFCFAPSFDFFSGLSLVIRGIMSCLFSFPFLLRGCLAMYGSYGVRL